MPLKRAKASKISLSLDIPSQQVKKTKQCPHFRPGQKNQQFKKTIQNCSQQSLAELYQQSYSSWDNSRLNQEHSQKMDLHRLKQIIILMASGQPIELSRCPYKSDSSDQFQRCLYQLLNLSNESKIIMMILFSSGEELPSDQYLSKVMNEGSANFVSWIYLNSKCGISSLQKNNYRRLLENSLQRQFQPNKLPNPPIGASKKRIKEEEMQDMTECYKLMQQYKSFKNAVTNPDNQYKTMVNLQKETVKEISKYFAKMQIIDKQSFLKLFDDTQRQEQDIVLQDILNKFKYLYKKSEFYLKNGLSSYKDRKIRQTDCNQASSNDQRQRMVPHSTKKWQQIDTSLDQEGNIQFKLIYCLLKARKKKRYKWLFRKINKLFTRKDKAFVINISQLILCKDFNEFSLKNLTVFIGKYDYLSLIDEKKEQYLQRQNEYLDLLSTIALDYPKPTLPAINLKQKKRIIGAKNIKDVQKWTMELQSASDDHD